MRPGPPSYLLDTCILVHLLRGNRVGQQIDAEFSLRSRLGLNIISVVTVGEMLSLGRHLSWGERRLAEMRAMLDQLVQVDISVPEILDAYGEIDAESMAMGRNMGKNDVWIAATARAANLTLLTADGHFDHLAGKFLDRVKIDAKTGKMI